MRGAPPSEEDMDLFVVRTRLYHVEGDPAAADEAAGCGPTSSAIADLPPQGGT